MHRIVSLLCAAVVLSAAQKAYAQFPCMVFLNAKQESTAITPPTNPEHRYRITVEGTWSPDSLFGCTLADAVWLYESIATNAALVESPKQPTWLGDTAKITLRSGKSVVPSRNLGFRVDGRPLPQLPPDTILHRYQFTQTGNGIPFQFSLLTSSDEVPDSNLASHASTACGHLKITVEEISKNQLNICGVEPKISANANTQLCIRANMYKADGNTREFSKNSVYDMRRVGVICDGHFVCADSMQCDESNDHRLDVALIVDNSGSMGAKIQFGADSVTRMRAIQIALTNFVSSRKDADSVCLLRFDSTCVLSSDWTSNQTQLRNAVYKLRSAGNTALHRAILDGIQKMSYRPNPNKAIIVMTDGNNNCMPLDESPVTHAIRSANIPLYIIALGFGNSPDDQRGIAAMKRFVNAAPDGQLFYANSADDLINAYNLLSANISVEPCCKIFVTIPPCSAPSQDRQIQLAVPYNESVITKKIVVNCQQLGNPQLTNPIYTINNK